MKLQTVMFTSFMVVSSYAHAAGWYTGTVNRVQVTSAGTLIVYVNGNNNECGSTSVQLKDSTAAGADWIFSHILANQAQERKIQFLIESCSGTRGLFTHVEDLN